ncbi:Dyp-type peroxidase [Ornithinimicrobium panacihumi]|uniref:Dyp-type peroxidase n=1 Tax=Ornithinimicrobium panacihumi TaxID=2008449 RepID=UPI003F89C4F6
MTTGASGLDRRTLLRGGLLGGASAVGLAAGVATAPSPGAGASRHPGGPATSGPSAAPADPTQAGELREPAHGRWHAGILTPPQPHASFVALDLVDAAGREELGRLMRLWGEDIARLTTGRAPVTDQEPELAARAAGLTVTVGWGASLFVKAGMTSARPSWLRPLPAFAIDRLDARWGEADLLLQAAAQSPLTVAHARRELVRAAGGIADVRWVQTGFREPMERHGWPLRNQLGQVDGTVQPEVGVDGSGRDLGLVTPRWTCTPPTPAACPWSTGRRTCSGRPRRRRTSASCGGPTYTRNPGPTGSPRPA